MGPGVRRDDVVGETLSRGAGEGFCCWPVGGRRSHRIREDQPPATGYGRCRKNILSLAYYQPSVLLEAACWISNAVSAFSSMMWRACSGGASTIMGGGSA